MSGERILLAGVMGHPVAHSRSPRLHGYWLRRLGLPGHYVPLDVAPENLREVLACLPKAGFVGVNVTIPHKEAVLALADIVTDRAALIGAANTLTFQADGRIRADNTDGHGFLENLRQTAPHWRAEDGPAVVLGAGGAARAVIVALRDAGAPEIVICNRTRVRAEQLCQEFGARLRVEDWAQAGNAIARAATLVNTTSLGMAGQPDLPVALDRLQPGTVVNDLVYTPLETRLLRIAAERGCIAVDGLGMLIHQAVPGFERWFGARPEVDAETREVLL